MFVQNPFFHLTLMQLSSFLSSLLYFSLLLFLPPFVPLCGNRLIISLSLLSNRRRAVVKHTQWVVFLQAPGTRMLHKVFMRLHLRMSFASTNRQTTSLSTLMCLSAFLRSTAARCMRVYIYIYIYIYMCVCLCLRDRKKGREKREGERLRE